MAEAGDGAGRALDAGGIGDLAAEHLVAGAEAEDAAAAAEVGGDVDVEAGGAEGGEVGDGGLRAGEEDEVGVAGEGRAGPDADEFDLRVGGERVEVVEVGDVREDRDGDADRAAGGGRPGVRARASSAGRRRAGSKKGTRPMARQPVRVGDRRPCRWRRGQDRRGSG